MDKKDREVSVGLYLKKNRDVAIALEKAFTDIIHEFLIANNLDIEVVFFPYTQSVSTSMLREKLAQQK